MSSPLPPIPPGSGQHPIVMIVLPARDVAASMAFYATIFGWQLQRFGDNVAAGLPPGGPLVNLRADEPEGAPVAVPFIVVPDVSAALDELTSTGATVARPLYSTPMIGELARFADPSGTTYGLATAASFPTPPSIPAPFGDAPRPPEGALCSIEMYAADGGATAAWFTERFGWGTMPTMPQYVMFDPGAGIGGVWQSHTPATRAMPYVYMSDVAATLTAIDGAGGKRTADAMVAPGMACFGYFEDPAGIPMGIMGPA